MLTNVHEEVIGFHFQNMGTQHLVANLSYTLCHRLQTRGIGVLCIVCRQGTLFFQLYVIFSVVSANDMILLAQTSHDMPFKLDTC